MKSVAVIATDTQLLNDFQIPDNLITQLRRADDFINLAVVCGKNALEKSPVTVESKHQTGIYIGTAYGPLESNFLALGSLIDSGEGEISPTLFSHSVYNAAAGYIARLLDIQGPALTLTTYTWPFITALNQARLAILAGRLSRAIVIGVETYSALLQDAYIRSHDSLNMPWLPGVTTLVLQKKTSATPRLCTLGDVIIIEKPCHPSLLLARTGEEWYGVLHRQGRGSHPLAYAYALTGILAEMATTEQPGVWHIKAPFGTVTIEIKY